MAEIIPFNTSEQVTEILSGQGEIGTYGDLALALENNPGWRVIEGGKTITNPVEGTSNVIPISNYIKPTPALEGGAVGATEAIEITAGAETVTASSSGLFAGWTLGTAVAGILAGCGVGIAAYDLAPEFWTGLSNALFGTEIDFDEIKDYRITGLIKDELLGGVHQNTTYLPYEIVQEVLDYCANYGLFESSYIPSTGDYDVGEYYSFPINDSSSSILYSVLNLYMSQNQNVIGTDFFNLFLNNFGRLITYFESNIGNRNLICVRAGSGLSSGRPISSFIEVNAYEIQLPFNHRIGEKYTYSIGDGIVGYKLNDINELGNVGTCLHFFYRAWEGVSDVEIITDTASVYTPPLVGTWLDTSNIQFGITEVNITNLGTDFDLVNEPGSYELPDNPTIYDPTKTIAQQYPDWYNRLINTSGLKLPYDDPSLYPIPWLPTVMPDYDPITEPEKYPTPSAEPSPSPYPQTDPQPWAQTGKMPRQLPNPYPDPNPTPDTTKDPRTGDDKPVDNKPSVDPTPTPPIVFPTVGGEANAIFTVYNPTLAQLNSLAGVLWSANFLDNLIKIFTNNPMDAIISLHMLYATPTTGNSKEIILGCYSTGVSALEVTKQYLEINCGTVRIPEYFGDARDYVNTVVDVYLPFVGMRHLKTQDIIGSNVTIKACVDVFTGTILYTINIRKSSGINQVMYAIEGNCAVQLPLTGADKSRMFSVLGAAATGAAVGGVAGAIGGAALSAMNGSAQADVQRSGNFGSNAGAMGVKKPYIVVSRNIGYDSNNYNKYHGLPANITVSLGSCSGYTKVLDCHLTNISMATDSELQEIERLLKTGVIL